MKTARYSTLIITFLVLLIAPYPSLASHTAKGNVESYGEINRDKVVRVRSVGGDVVLKTGTDGEWVRAHEYMILTDGYIIVSGPGGFAEIELDQGRFVRMNENSEISLSEVSSHAVIFRYTSGGVYVSALEGHTRRIEFALGPMRSVNLYGAGAFRIDDDPQGVKAVSVREGRVSVEYESGKLDVYEGNMAKMDGNVVVETAYGRDSWDVFVEKRDNEVLALVGEPTIYEEIPGRYKWYGYSEWVAYPSYGYFWWPHLSFVFFGHHGHQHHGHLHHRRHIHSGISFGINLGQRHHRGHRHFKGYRLHKRHLLHRNRHLFGDRHLHKGKHLRRGKHRSHIRNRNRGRHESGIFRRGGSRHESHIFKRGNHSRRGHSRSGGHLKKWRGGNKSRSFSSGKSFRGRSFRGRGGRSMRMGGGSVRGGRGRR